MRGRPINRTIRDGRKTRPIGIPTFEDKVLQRAVVMVLESVYEQDFLDESFGFRPGRSAHGALQTFWEQTMKMGGGWVIDLDIQGFFDTLDHRHLRGFLDRRVRDGVLRRAIDKWLKAGVLEDGRLRRSTLGTPQGGVVFAAAGEYLPAPCARCVVHDGGATASSWAQRPRPLCGRRGHCH